MTFAKKKLNEDERLKAIQDYNILDSLPEKDFGDITKFAAELFSCPISFISIIDRHRQWFKSKVGLNINQTPREDAFCNYAISFPDKIMEVEDARLDERFKNNPLVKGYPKIVAYIAVPLVSKAGHCFGTLCLIDIKPRKFSDKEKFFLRVIANNVISNIEWRKAAKDLKIYSAAQNKLLHDLKESGQMLENFAFTVAHDIRSPLRSINSLVDLVKLKIDKKEYHDIDRFFNHISASVYFIKDLVENLIKFAKSGGKKEEQPVCIQIMLKKILAKISHIVEQESVKIEVDSLPEVLGDAIQLEQLFYNLVVNAINHAETGNLLVKIGFCDDGDFYKLFVSDNGSGIAEKDQVRIFQPFNKCSNKNNNGVGLGLSICQRIVHNHGGKIWCEAKVEQGTTFYFTLKKNKIYSDNPNLLRSV